MSTGKKTSYKSTLKQFKLCMRCSVEETFGMFSPFKKNEKAKLCIKCLNKIAFYTPNNVVFDERYV